jgi:hypothetical protein
MPTQKLNHLLEIREKKCLKSFFFLSEGRRRKMAVLSLWSYLKNGTYISVAIT